jgi:hypothetical protein
VILFFVLSGSGPRWWPIGAGAGLCQGDRLPGSVVGPPGPGLTQRKYAYFLPDTGTRGSVSIDAVFGQPRVGLEATRSRRKVPENSHGCRRTPSLLAFLLVRCSAAVLLRCRGSPRVAPPESSPGASMTCASSTVALDEQLHVPVAGPGTQSRHVQPSLGIIRLFDPGPRLQLVGERRPALPGGQIDPATRLSQVALQQYGQHLQIDRERMQDGDRRISHGRSQLVRQFLVGPEPALLEFADKRGRHLRSPRQAPRRGPGHTIAGQLQHLTHGSTLQRGKQRHPVLNVERASHGSQPVLVPSLGHGSDRSARHRGRTTPGPPVPRHPTPCRCRSHPAPS